MYGRGNLHPELQVNSDRDEDPGETWALDQASGQCSEAWLEGSFLSIAKN